VSFIQRVKPVDVLRYGFLPGVIPRIKEFANNGFGWLALLMATLYAAVGLLPRNHPYLKSSNLGRFGIRHVITEAAGRLVLKKENIDQIVMFFVVLLGFILLIAQFAVLVAGFIFTKAHAQIAVAPFGSFFLTNAPDQDIAYQLLDLVFAIPDLYNSNFDPATRGMTPFNVALHDLLHFYNVAILIVAVLIFLYYIVLVVAETANTGSPFGRRFSHIYAPLRLVIAIGLLIPLNYGLNGSQYITLFAAKFGSSLATNTWILFNQTIVTAAGGGSSPLGTPRETMISRPQIPDIADIVQFMSVVRACKSGFESAYQTVPYATLNATLPALNIQPYLVWGTAGSRLMAGTPYVTAVGPAVFNHRDITIRFGHKDENVFSDQRGYVYPFCGEITIHVDDTTQIGSQQVQQGYYNFVRALWNNAGLVAFGNRMAAKHIQQHPDNTTPQNVIVPDDVDGNGDTPVEAFKQARVNEATELVRTFITTARDNMVAGTNFGMPPELLNRGWGGAAIWYNRIAMWNGALLGAVHNTPTPARVPEPMEKCEKERRANDQNVDSIKRYECYLKDGKTPAMQENNRAIATMLSVAYEYWRTDNSTARPDQRLSGNVFMDMMNMLFPFNALFQIRYNIDVHPLAQLVGLGKSIIDSAVRNLMIGLAFGAGGGLTSAMGYSIGGTLNAFSGMFVSMTTIGLTMGFILYYVLPFLPFMYFFFAVGSWVKTIFEAMVGAPLWALAHLRIDGNGLPGEMAMGGYFMIFEIFMRPVLTLFGLLGGLTIFSATVRVFHEYFRL
jgi:conjugal transfer/type IV secretion protein DotA/TraY